MSLTDNNNGMVMPVSPMYGGDNAAQTAALEQYLAPTPKPCYPVQNPNCCAPQTFGCGCGSVA